MDNLRKVIERDIEDPRWRADVRARAEERFAATVAARAPRSSRRRSTWIIAGIAVAGASAAIAITAIDHSAPVVFQVGASGERGSVGAWVMAPSDGSLPMRFSDGSSVTLAPAARAQLTAADSSGGQIVLGHGTLDATIAHRPHARWSFVAGPFEVVVTGTRFRLSWDNATSAFSITMVDGSVVVRAACLHGPERLSAGQSLKLSCAAGANAPPAAPTLDPSERDRTDGARANMPPLLRRTPPRHASSPAGRADAWTELARDGRYGDALAAVVRIGFSHACETLPEPDLLRLGSIARLAGDEGRARAVFDRLRRRFPGGDAAAVAAFTLGRMALEQRHDAREAIRWFETYRRERPDGALAGDALGRLMEAESKAGQRAAADQHAREYRARHPDGPYAGLARSLLTQ